MATTSPRTPITRRIAKCLAAAALAGTSLIATTPAAHAQNISGGGCRVDQSGNLSYAYVGFGISLADCAFNGGPNAGAMTMRVYVSGNASTDLRLYAAVATVSGGSVTDRYTNGGFLIPQGPIGAYIDMSGYCGYGTTMVVDAYVTESGNRYGSVQSPRFTC
ncbi:hypothetical protein [Streptomyces rubellomurinus]|uniref:Spore-associated protein A n=2 Tax=Streptomyces TaxID=1883 RepID=A0A0F2TMP2_STRR3|nr:hypothetical protein [Streptomyces rubellomurinus]KJS55014.1 hypothetical protein VM98_15570 [Streptomyces rubellomurinus subsp. indigoferus]KJS62992.1 hypothetical protein VM95_05805 [Streptomyces rubellomurinus]